MARITVEQVRAHPEEAAELLHEQDRLIRIQQSMIDKMFQMLNKLEVVS